MATQICVSIASSNGFLPAGTKTLQYRRLITMVPSHSFESNFTQTIILNNWFDNYSFEMYATFGWGN